MSAAEVPWIERQLRKAAFVVWSPRYKGTRSAWLAAELGIASPTYFAPTSRRGLSAAPLKYPRQVAGTLVALARARPRVVFVQSPPSFATWTAALYATLARAALVIDVHSDAFERDIWTRPSWLNRLVFRRAAVTIVTARHWAELVQSMGGRAVVVPAVPTTLEVGEPPALGDFAIVFVATWATDEPLLAVFEAARLCPDAAFYVTGRPQPERYDLNAIPGNVHLTGFLSEAAYNGLLNHANAVMCLTTRDHTMQNGAAEALYLGTPVITSNWQVLREFFSRGTIHVDNSPESIADAVRRMMADGERYRAEIRSLRDEVGERWLEDRATILSSIEEQLRSLRPGDRNGAR
jgi:glycosyltransferase involved in cell wall biosynthesis